MLHGKKLSILGDSISTYKGVSNDASANATLFYNPCYRLYHGFFKVEDTYWHMVMERLGLELCVNNSWSSGNLCGRDDPSSGVNRANHLARDDGELPDVIIVFMGTNDLGRGFGVEVFGADYRRTLETLKERYPDAAVCCVNLPDRHPSVHLRTKAFNRQIAAAASAMGEGYFVADLYSSPLKNDNYYNNTLDGLHPDPDGMRMIADAVEAAMREHFR